MAGIGSGTGQNDGVYERTDSNGDIVMRTIFPGTYFSRGIRNYFATDEEIFSPLHFSTKNSIQESTLQKHAKAQQYVLVLSNIRGSIH